MKYKYTAEVLITFSVEAENQEAADDLAVTSGTALVKSRFGVRPDNIARVHDTVFKEIKLEEEHLLPKTEKNDAPET